MRERGETFETRMLWADRYNKKRRKENQIKNISLMRRWKR
jgi:hypothetical protein